ncbi:MAG: phosphoenolpyruvate synthase [Sphingobacteriales bacterium]|nr:phosphoenolpyruvate synthase [Sphingobacteriales bacterium]
MPFSKYYRFSSKIDETSFHLLMKKRIHQVLLISSAYDSFMLEEDGRIDEQIFNEYTSLSLRYPPTFIHATSAESAFQILASEKIDLIINMLSIEDMDPFELAKNIKGKYSWIPIVVLTPFSREVSLKLTNEDLSAVDYVFSWLGNADLLLAIIKLIEDKMNVEDDVINVGVQTIILVEDSIRFYSSYLPLLYKIIFRQSREFITEALNEHQKMLRLRGRPKVLLATNYEEAITFYEKYKNNLLGVITDISYKRNNETDKLAGVKLCRKLKEEDLYLPVLLQSSELENEKYARELDVKFLYKESKTLPLELRDYINEYLAFGPFIFRDPKTKEEIGRAIDLQDLQHKLFDIPDDSFIYHIERNHFSKWLNARALFPIADKLKYMTMEDFNKDLDQIRRYIYDAIVAYRLNKGRGIIADFDRTRFDEFTIFSRIGEGSIGGKARGLAFIDSMIKKHDIIDKFQDVIITIPRTVVISTDIFDEFLEINNLWEIALSDLPDEAILSHFLNAHLPVKIHADLLAFLSVIKNPIAVRSSSLLEDSHYQPFAGVYSTYMVPNVKTDERTFLELVSNAIKAVYASVFYKSSKAYMQATSNVIDAEKMAIVLQEVCGNQYNGKFYPTLSGVARSINFYPIDPEKSKDGVANVAFGLGKYIVDGGVSLRFSPKHPKRIIQLSSTENALRETQKYFYALDMENTRFIPSTDDSCNMLKLKISEAEAHGSLKYVVSTYDFQNDIIRDGYFQNGKIIVTFSPILNHHLFPLSDILSYLLEIGQKEMNKPIEIEFAVNLNVPKDSPKIFNYLQIRPIVQTDEKLNCKIEDIEPNECIIYSNSALGNGIINDIYDFIYVKPDTFKSSATKQIAEEIEKLNAKMADEKRYFVLVGPGRWGSSDPWLGIPVKWAQICQARIIVESGLSSFRIDPSQGTHFFQNLTSFRVGYFTINPFINDGYFDLDYLKSKECVFENQYLKHIRFQNPIKIKIDGQKNIGVVLKEEYIDPQNVI